MVLRLGCGAECTHRAAVKAASESDDLVAVLRLAVQAGQFDGGLIGLGSAVAEEAHSSRIESFGKCLAEQGLRLGVPGVWDVDECRDLLLHRLHNSRRTVPEQTASPPWE